MKYCNTHKNSSLPNKAHVSDLWPWEEFDINGPHAMYLLRGKNDKLMKSDSLKNILIWKHIQLCVFKWYFLIFFSQRNKMVIEFPVVPSL